MFDLIPNYQVRDISGELSVEELVQTLKNPSIIQKKIVDMARKVGKHNYPYDKIKGALPCFIPFYRHNNKVNKGTLKKATNYIYIDIDEDVSFDPSQHDFVVACWKSLSGNGKGVLISVDNMVPPNKVTTEILKKIVFEVSNSMDINPDLGAVSLDRVNVIGYDEDVYYNPQHSSYTLSNNFKENFVKESTKKLSSSNKTPSFNRLRLDDTFSNDGIRTSNLDDKIKDIVFGDNELVRDLGDDKIPYAHVFIPSKIDTGERNTKLHYITSAIYGLNPSISKGRLINYIYKVNSSVCEDSMDREEVEDICNKVYSKGPLLYENKTRRYLFNPNANLSGGERRSIAVTMNNKSRGEKTTKKIISTIREWDFEKMGKITYSKISEITGISKSTVQRNNKKIKSLIKEVSQELIIS